MVPGQPPINQDYLYWNQMAGMGYPMGPPPPLYTDNPWYTGENVFSPPGTFISPMQNIALQGGLLAPGGGGMGGPGPGGGGQDGVLKYPSQRTLQDQAPPAVPGMTDPVQTGQQGLSDLDRYILQQEFDRMNQAWAADPEASLVGGASYRQLSPEGQEFMRGMDPYDAARYYRKLR